MPDPTPDHGPDSFQQPVNGIVGIPVVMPSGQDAPAIWDPRQVPVPDGLHLEESAPGCWRITEKKVPWMARYAIYLPGVLIFLGVVFGILRNVINGVPRFVWDSILAGLMIYVIFKFIYQQVGNRESVTIDSRGITIHGPNAHSLFMQDIKDVSEKQGRYLLSGRGRVILAYGFDDKELFVNRPMKDISYIVFVIRQVLASHGWSPKPAN